MVDRQNRLKEVYEYVRQFKGIHTQIDFAIAVNYSRTAISLALNGKESYLTDKLFENICKAFPDTFSIDYLLTGEGQLLINQEEVKQGDQPIEPIPMWADTMISIIAKQIKENETLHRELKQSILEFNAARVELEKILYKLSNSSSSAASYGNPKEPSSDGNLAAENNHPFPQQ